MLTMCNNQSVLAYPLIESIILENLQVNLVPKRSDTKTENDCKAEKSIH